VPKCPFCRKEINRVDIHVDPHTGWEYYTCSKCKETLPLDDLFEVKDFLEERYVILHPDDPEIEQKGDFFLFRGKIYRAGVSNSLFLSLFNLLSLRLVEGKPFLKE